MKKILYIFVAATLLTACNDDFLDKKPLNKLSEKDVFSNAALIESYVNGMYAVVPDYFEEGNVACITDEGFFRYGGTSTNYIARGLMTPDNVMYMSEGGGAHNSRTTTLNIWNRAYTYIRNMNDFFEQVKDNTVLEESVKKRLSGEVYFLRAWAYFNLVQRFGGVPLITTLYKVGDTYDVKRSDFDTCIDFILSDLSKAKALLPDKAAVLGRVSKDACLALESRVTLWAASPLFNDPAYTTSSLTHGAYSLAKWTRARDAAKAIVDRADVDFAYELGATYDDFWKNTASKEVIWAKFFNINAGKSAQLYYSPVYFNGWIGILPTEVMVAEFEMAATGKKIFETGSGYDPAHPWDGRDPRFYKIICPPNGIYRDSTFNNMIYYDKYKFDGTNPVDVTSDNYLAKVTYDHIGRFLWNTSSDSGYNLKKWHIEKSEVSESVNTTIMQPWFRLAEMYLNYAEACYMTGDEAGCRNYINKVRGRADVMMPEITDSGANLYDRLIQERRIELCYECGFRYFDLRRWKLASFFENVPIYGIRTLAFPHGGTAGYALTDSYGKDVKVLYRIAEKYNPSAPQRDYYNTNNTSAGKPNAKQVTYVYNGRTYKIDNNIVTYPWLGENYVVDYGNCTDCNMSPQKNFPERQYFMPIPRNEITKSNNTIEQNPGYN